MSFIGSPHCDDKARVGLLARGLEGQSGRNMRQCWRISRLCRVLRRGAWAVALALVSLAGLASGQALAEPHELASDNTLAVLCGIVEDSAKAEGLPVNFFTRLIWRRANSGPAL